MGQPGSMQCAIASPVSWGLTRPVILLNPEGLAASGHADAIIAQMKGRFDPEDRLMLWFDFNNHDSKRVMKNMADFMTRVAARFR